MKSNFTLIIIAGPTGIGKTALAIKLAKVLKTEVISCDSRQVYKEMSIGTAVPTVKEQDGIPHHLLQHKSIFDYYNASIFENEVLSIIEQKKNTHDCIIMTGGSGLYMDAVCYGIDDMPTINMDIRNTFRSIFETDGLEKIKELLKLADPEYYAMVDLNNPKRILKALEITEMTGIPYSKQLKRTPKNRNFNILKIGLTQERNILYEKVDNRVNHMIQTGLLKEAKVLYPINKQTQINSLNTVGYKELFEFFDKKIPIDEAIQKIKFNTHAYIRRQITWFSKYSDMNYFDVGATSDIVQFVFKNCK